LYYCPFPGFTAKPDPVRTLEPISVQRRQMARRWIGIAQRESSLRLAY